MTQQQYKKIIDDFRIYYNQDIFPILSRLERERRLLSLSFILAIVGFMVIGYFSITAKVSTIVLLSWIPVVGIGFWVFRQIQRFRMKFKPRLVNLILDFIDKKIEQGSTRRQQEIEQRIQAFDLEVNMLKRHISETKQKLYYKIEQRLEDIARQLETGVDTEEIDVVKTRVMKLGEEVKSLKTKIANARKNPDKNSQQRIEEMEEQLLKVEKQLKALNLTLTEGLETQIVKMENQIQLLEKHTKHLRGRIGESIQAKIEYSFKDKISIKTFLASRIFYVSPYLYTGEDYIRGAVGSAAFEMSELEVLKLSRVRTRYDLIFRGIFFKANFYHEADGLVVFYPREERQFLSNTIKHLTSTGCKKIALPTPELEAAFIAYADSNVSIDSLISREIFQSIMDYKNRSGKKIYVSFVNGYIYIAISETKNILEPQILHSNTNFKLVNEFFEDLLLIISIVEDFDLHH